MQGARITNSTCKISLSATIFHSETFLDAATTESGPENWIRLRKEAELTLESPSCPTPEMNTSFFRVFVAEKRRSNELFVDYLVRIRAEG